MWEEDTSSGHGNRGPGMEKEWEIATFGAVIWDYNLIWYIVGTQVRLEEGVTKYGVFQLFPLIVVMGSSFCLLQLYWQVSGVALSDDEVIVQNVFSSLCLFLGLSNPDL